MATGLLTAAYQYAHCETRLSTRHEDWYVFGGAGLREAVKSVCNGSDGKTVFPVLTGRSDARQLNGFIEFPGHFLKGTTDLSEVSLVGGVFFFAPVRC